MADDLGNGSADLLPELKLMLRVLAPARAEAIISYFRDRHHRRQVRLAALASAAEDEGQLSFEELLDRASRDDARSDLAERILLEASRTSAEWKMRSLGRALAQGVLAEDDAALDELQLMLRAIEDLEAPHVRVLSRLYTEGTRHRGLPDYDLASMFPNGVRVLYSLLMTLERHGLAGELESARVTGERGPDTDQIWAIWDFGILLIERLLHEGRVADT